MEKKEIQRQRMMTYFIEAAKEIIKEEGVKSVTARKVGEKAGYSYATIYNYFSDLNALLTYCVFDFLEDCYKHLLTFKDDTKNSKEQLVDYVLAYFTYFAENPDMFHLIFIEDLGKPPEGLVKNNRPSVVIQLRENISKCAKSGYIDSEDIDLLVELIASSIHGKLMFFFKRTDKEGIEEIVSQIKNEMNYIINEERDEWVKEK